jgi:hypothetical protein
MNPFTALKNPSPFHFTFFSLILSTLHFTLLFMLIISTTHFTSLHLTSLFIAFTSPHWFSLISPKQHRSCKSPGLQQLPVYCFRRWKVATSQFINTPDAATRHLHTHTATLHVSPTTQISAFLNRFLESWRIHTATAAPLFTLNKSSWIEYGILLPETKKYRLLPFCHYHLPFCKQLWCCHLSSQRVAPTRKMEENIWGTSTI